VYSEVLMDGQLLQECGHRKSLGRVSPACVVEGVSAHDYYHHAAILAPTTDFHTRDPRHFIRQTKRLESHCGGDKTFHSWGAARKPCLGSNLGARAVKLVDFMKEPTFFTPPTKKYILCRRETESLIGRSFSSDKWGFWRSTTSSACLVNGDRCCLLYRGRFFYPLIRLIVRDARHQSGPGHNRCQLFYIDLGRPWLIDRVTL
jgi:hypothetical protein